MKNLTIYIVFAIVLLTSSSFQGKCQYNLVPNPSFEQYTTCPITIGQLTFATYWTEGVTNVSPEFFHACNNAGNNVAGVPQNKFGYQHARTGLAYAGICNGLRSLGYANKYREYIQTELIDSLEAGLEYTIEFYVSAADSCGSHSNNFGAYFSTTEIDTVIYPQVNLPFQPQFENPVTHDLSDRIGWTLVSGTFIAGGGEKYLIIGNFRDSLNATIIPTGWGTWPPNIASAYLYIDDVLVAPTDSLTSISEDASNEDLTLLTLSDNEFEINSKYHTIDSYEVVNGLGQIINKKVKVNENSVRFNLQELANGIYFIQVRLKNYNSHILKIFKT